MKLSIVVPVWNREKLIIRCLDSILGQEEKPLELIVVDNNSTDSTYKKVEDFIALHKDSNIKLKLLKETTPGACAARQKGFENSEGDYVIFFDSDDVMLPSLIKEADEALKRNPDSDIICWPCRINQLDKTQRVPPFMIENPLEAHLIHTLLRPQGYIVSRGFLSDAGAWEKPLKVWNDFELGLRLLIKNPKITGIPKVLAELYSQEESITGIDFSSREGEWEKVLQEMERVTEKSESPQKEKIKRILDYRRAILAAHYYKEGNTLEGSALIKKTKAGKSLAEKFLLDFSYRFTRRGLRGAWKIVRFAY